MKMEGYPSDLSDNAYQFMRVVQSRGQLNDDSAMNNTFEVIYKVYKGTEKRVTPKDLNIMLSNMGSAATQLSDDGIFNLAALISVNKQDLGE